MTWHRIHYTASLQTGGLVSGVIDVLGEVFSWETYCAIRKRHPGIAYHLPIELDPRGKGDGTLAVNRDPRDDESGTVAFQVKGS